MIGQAKITATPLTMAGVAAAVANGHWRAAAAASRPIRPSPGRRCRTLDTLRA